MADVTIYTTQFCPYCVAAGAILGAHNVRLESALAAWLQAFAMNLVQAGIRLGHLLNLAFGGG